MSRSISVRATPRSVSGLLAAPAITRQSSARARASSISPPAAHGASTSSSLARIASADGAISMPCCVGRAARSARSRGRSAITRAPASASRVASTEPTLPSPIDAHAPALEVVRAGGRGEPAPHSLEDRLGGHGGGVATAAVLARAPDGEAGEARHVVHVCRGRPDVLGGDVRAVEALDHAGRAPPGAPRAGRRGRRRSSRPCRRRARGRPRTPSASSCAPGPSRPRAPRAGRPGSASAAFLPAPGPSTVECTATMKRSPVVRVLADDDLLVIVVSQGDVRSRRRLGSNGHRP